MRPIKLTIKGLNIFIEEQTVDFDKLTSRGLFGIFGPTGSGKSTILHLPDTGFPDFLSLLNSLLTKYLLVSAPDI